MKQIPYETRVAICNSYPSKKQLLKLQQVDTMWHGPTLEAYWCDFRWLDNLDAVQLGDMALYGEMVKILRLSENSRALIPTKLIQQYMSRGVNFAWSSQSIRDTVVKSDLRFIEFSLVENPVDFCALVQALMPNISTVNLSLKTYSRLIVDPICKQLSLKNIAVNCTSSGIPSEGLNLHKPPSSGWESFSTLRSLDISYFRVPSLLLKFFSLQFPELKFLKISMESCIKIDSNDIQFRALKCLEIDQIYHSNRDDELSFNSDQFPELESLSCHNVFPSVDQHRPSKLFKKVLNSSWNKLKILKLPFITDVMATSIAKNCTRLYELQAETDHFYHSPPNKAMPSEMDFADNESDAVIELANELSEKATLKASESAEVENSGQENDTGFNSENILSNNGFLAIVQSLQNLTNLHIGSNVFSQSHDINSFAVLPEPINLKMRYNNCNNDNNDLVTELIQIHTWACAKSLKKLMIQNWKLTPKALAVLLSNAPNLESMNLHIENEDIYHLLERELNGKYFANMLFLNITSPKTQLQMRYYKTLFSHLPALVKVKTGLFKPGLINNLKRNFPNLTII
ncbi:hypothetical protein H4219_004457 [Mycoemilia scoparia]|uniref:Uncharacterized protein n=1 Tax=Mycoemilia scoparia TaxID=417184 RepID=A0A9W7ZY93_9FUNG|nr:hypothetical protein H4219_004457 [Mycoemilia scoparia]